MYLLFCFVLSFFFFSFASFSFCPRLLTYIETRTWVSPHHRLQSQQIYDLRRQVELLQEENNALRSQMGQQPKMVWVRALLFCLLRVRQFMVRSAGAHKRLLESTKDYLSVNVKCLHLENRS